MIRHVILFKLKDRSPENIKRGVEALKTLKDKVPAVRSLEVGIDALRSERSFDIALTVTFDSLEALDEYQNHPGHVEVANYIRGITESAAVVDYKV